MQFEIFKMEQLMMELNTISSAALQESDLVNEGKKKLLSSMVIDSMGCGYSLGTTPTAESASL
jgi:hypothetical protein